MDKNKSVRYFKTYRKTCSFVLYNICGRGIRIHDYEGISNNLVEILELTPSKSKGKDFGSGVKSIAEAWRW